MGGFRTWVYRLKATFADVLFLRVYTIYIRLIFKPGKLAQPAGQTNEPTTGSMIGPAFHRIINQQPVCDICMPCIVYVVHIHHGIVLLAMKFFL